jgi:hypothetical protein
MDAERRKRRAPPCWQSGSPSIREFVGVSAESLVALSIGEALSGEKMLAIAPRFC